MSQRILKCHISEKMSKERKKCPRREKNVQGICPRLMSMEVNVRSQGQVFDPGLDQRPLSP